MKPAHLGRLGAVVALATVAFVASIPSVGAEPGDLDSTFGVCGMRTHSVPPNTSVHTTLTQSNGKILQVGQVRNGAISVTRLVASGAGVDHTYGSDGTALVALPRLKRVVAAALGPNDTVVVAGARNANGAMDLVRLTSAGAPDPTFGTDGVVRSSRLAPWGIVIQADNRIVVWRGPHPPLLERYNADGTRDAAWQPHLPDEDGAVATAAPADNGDLLVAFQFVDHTQVFRFHADGSPDATFAGSFAFPSGDPMLTAHFQPGQIIEVADGKILVIGSGFLAAAGPTYEHFIGVVRLDATGDLDPAYGDAGFGRMDVSGGASGTARLDVEDRLVVTAQLGIDPLDSPLLLGRFTAAGFPDPDFGRGGTVAFDLGVREVTGLSLRGKWILVAAFVDVGGESPSLLRFRTDSTKLGAGYALDRAGRLYPFRFGTDPPPPCVTDGPGPQLFGLVRGATTVTNRGGLVVDAFGGLHRFSIGARPAPAAPKDGPYWPGFDIARGVAALANGKGGYVLDGYGGIHRYRTGSNPMPPAIENGPYWPGWDIARGIALMPGGKAGYVLDAFGGIHRFSVPGQPLPPPIASPFSSPGHDFGRSIAILADGTGGYVGAGAAFVWPVGVGTHAAPPLPTGFPELDGRDFVGVTFVAPRVGP